MAYGKPFLPYDCSSLILSSTDTCCAAPPLTSTDADSSSHPLPSSPQTLTLHRNNTPCYLPTALLCTCLNPTCCLGEVQHCTAVLPLHEPLSSHCLSHIALAHALILQIFCITIHFPEGSTLVLLRRAGYL